MRMVLVLDTSILCVWLGVPGKGTCGPDDDTWDLGRVTEKLGREEAAKTTLVLPLASIIETGNHIAHANSWTCASALADLMCKAADETSPWAPFTRQMDLWSDDKLRDLAGRWPGLAVQGLGIGDATIADVADFYAAAGFQVDIWTGDQGLKAREPMVPSEVPRRRR